MASKLKLIFILLTAMHFIGCSAYQHATFSRPYIESKEISQFPHGDGIALKLPSICVVIEEGWSADYRAISAGPLIFPIIPTPQILYEEHNPDFYDIDLAFVTYDYENTFSFEPSKVTLKLDDGSVITPNEYRVYSILRNKIPPILTIDKLDEPVMFRGRHYAILLRFNKVNEHAQMTELSLKDLHTNDKTINIPTIYFEPRRTYRRILPPGRSANNHLFNLSREPYIYGKCSM